MCDCREVVDKRLALSNSRIATGFMFSNGMKMDLMPPMIVLEKIEAKKHGAKTTLLATCCPFCGERYPD